MDINTLHNTILNKFSNVAEDEKIAIFTKIKL